MAKYKEAVMINGTRIVHGVPRKLEGVSREIQLAIVMWDEVRKEMGFSEGVVTALGDGVHTAKHSKHYGTYRLNAGKMGWWIDAADLRTNDIPESLWGVARDLFKEKLGPGYDVILHLEIPHMHVEYDPK